MAETKAKTTSGTAKKKTETGGTLQSSRLGYEEGSPCSSKGREVGDRRNSFVDPGGQQPAGKPE